jgi:hypothetical protein
VDKIDAAMDKAFGDIDSLPWGCLESFASVYDGRPELMKSDALLAGHVQRAYFEFTGLESVRSGIWRLCRGPARENVRKLKSGELLAEDENDGQLQTLLQEGHIDEDTGVATVELYGNIPFTTKVGEQAHASSTEVEGEHPGYGEEMHMARAGLHGVRALFRKPKEGGPRVREEKKLATKVKTLRRKNPNKAGGKQRLLKKLCAGRREQLAVKKLPFSDRKSAWQTHSVIFRTQSPETKRELREEARVDARDKKRTQTQELEWATAKRRKLASDRRQELRAAESSSLPLAVGNCRWSEEELQELARRWHLGHLRKEEITKARASFRKFYLIW